MSRHSIAEAQARLPELIARAAAGEEVVIANDDGPAVVLSLVPGGLGPVDPAKLAWLESLAVRPAARQADDLVERSRDAAWR
jgi:antitoxin (DNA-binding transcriptional repressor) of toxin-antitoxin stability system